MFKKNCFEEEAWKVQQLVCGIDEVGRGCVFGPLVMGCVILRPDCEAVDFDLLQDSKLLSQKKRENLNSWIKHNSLWNQTIILHPLIIDNLGINVATEIAVRRLVYTIPACYQNQLYKILIDLIKINFSKIKTDVPIISAAKGESWSGSIAAASILAKVFRDSLVDKMERFFPGYDLSKNKGYAAPKHINALLKNGESIMHRQTYCDTLLNNQRIKRGDISEPGFI